MKTPQISLVAMESRDPNRVFVRVPNERGRWMLVHRCVILRPCSVCKAAIGEPCKSDPNDPVPKYTVGHHYGRWTSAKYSYSNAKTPYVEHVGVTKEKE